MTKRLSLIVIACVALALLILPASAAVNQIAQGNDVFIGELGINITACVGGQTQLAWFAAGSSPASDVPNYIKSVGNAANFYVAPADFVGRTGNWYQWSGGSPAGGAAFNVLDPSIDVKIWDQKTVKDVSGKSVPAGDFLNFRIESNMYTIAQRPTYDPATNGQFTIKVKTADGFVYNALFQSTNTAISLLRVSVSQQPAYWVNPNNVNSIGWNTGVLDTQGTRMYRAGVYTCTAECNVNGIKDNYKAPDGSDYTGKTVSAARTVTIATDTVKVEASKDSVVKGNPFSVTITGKPSTPYYMWVKGTGQMSGDVNDRPPFIIPDQEGLTQDNVNGPYNIGNYMYQGGAGNTIKDDVPDKPSNGTIYYGLVTLKDTGTRTIGWQTTQETKDKKYTIRVELRSGVAPNYEYKSDEVDVKVEKGTVTVVAAGDQSYYLGQEVKLSGTNSETDTVYMFITGPNLPSVGGTLLDPRARVDDGDPFSFTTASVLDDNTWEYKWQTSNLNIDAGTYTVYAVATPNDRDNLGNTQYSTVSIIVKKPFVSAIASQSTVAAGDKLYIRGVAQGQPSVGIAIWTMGKNYAKYDTTSVNSDGSFEQEYTQGTTAGLASGQYFVVVQHPMYNDKFDVYPSGQITSNGPPVYALSAYPTQGSRIFQLTGPGSLQGSDAAEALVTAMDNPSIDDTYTKLQFLIDTPTININPVSQHMVGDKFVITGTTNLAVDDEILVEVVSSSFQPTQKTQSGEFSGATGTIKVVKGTGGLNTWSFPVDSKNFQPDEYIVDVSGITVSVSATTLFNVVAYVPTTIPTTVPTIISNTTPPTTAPTKVPTTVPTTTPGFGALVALVGLGAVAFLVVRKH